MKKSCLIPLLALTLLLSLTLSLLCGSVSLPWRALLSALSAGELSDPYVRVFLYARLPRVAGGCLAGMALSVSGVLLQGVFHNVLAGPNLIGVNAGAGLFAMLTMTVLPRGSIGIPAAAFLGALGAAALIWAISGAADADGAATVLIGVAVGSLLTAGMDALRTLFPDTAAEGAAFLSGSLAGVSPERLLPAGALILAGLLPALFLGRRLDVYSLGEDTAASLGMRVRRTRLLFMALAALLAGAAVSFAGLLGFVGLLVPHALRPFAGSTHRRLIPCAALAGGSLVLLCDLLARVLFAPYELPVGVVLSALGAPLFLWLLLKRRGGGQDA